MISNTGIKNIRKILLPIDGSATSMKAARYGTLFFPWFSSTLVAFLTLLF